MSKKVTTFESDMVNNTLSKAKAKEIKSLTAKKERDKHGLFLAEGQKCVEDMLDYFEPLYLICTRDWVNCYPKLAKRYEDVIMITDKRGIETVSSLSSLPEVIAVFRKPQESETISGLEPYKLYLLLDEIQDPGNLGTIIRTCDWFGVYDIYASKTTVDVFNPKVVQATMGSLARVKVHYVDLLELIESNPQIPVVGTLLEGKPLDETNKIESGFLLMGNEGRGISEELQRKIDLPLTIPPKNPHAHPDSLNVAIATAICLNRLTRNVKN